VEWERSMTVDANDMNDDYIGVGNGASARARTRSGVRAPRASATEARDGDDALVVAAVISRSASSVSRRRSSRRELSASLAEASA